eukprot:4604682-Amphidinium_carterae.1
MPSCRGVVPGLLPPQRDQCGSRRFLILRLGGLPSYNNRLSGMLGHAKDTVSVINVRPCEVAEIQFQRLTSQRMLKVPHGMLHYNGKGEGTQGISLLQATRAGDASSLLSWHLHVTGGFA